MYWLSNVSAKFLLTFSSGKSRYSLKLAWHLFRAQWCFLFSWPIRKLEPILQFNFSNGKKKYLILVRMAVIKKSTNSKFWRGCGENGTSLHCWWECKLVQPLWRVVWSFLKIIKIELPFDLLISLLNIYPEKMKTPTWKDMCILAALVIIIKTLKESKWPSTGWLV